MKRNKTMKPDERYELLCELEDIKDKLRVQSKIMDEIEGLVAGIQRKLRDVS